MDERPEPKDPLVSELAGDPDLQQLVDEFVWKLPGKADAMQKELARGDIATLTHLAHQLKGSAGGYGFPAISDAARHLEQTAKATKDLEAISDHIRELADLCRRAVSQPPQSS